jgi:phosphoribosylamine--glycine ligase
VVIAAEGYPGQPASGDEITGLAAAGQVPGAYVLHAGTRTDGTGHLVSAGGRVLNVVGAGPDLAAARAVAYQAAGNIELRGGWYRTDIAQRAAGRPAQASP